MGPRPGSLACCAGPYGYKPVQKKETKSGRMGISVDELEKFHNECMTRGEGRLYPVEHEPTRQYIPVKGMTMHQIVTSFILPMTKGKMLSCF